MRKSLIICLGLWISILLLTGCWDRKELNDRAIWLATGLDAGKNGGVEISGQITIPQEQSQGGGSGEQKGQNFFNRFSQWEKC